MVIQEVKIKYKPNTSIDVIHNDFNVFTEEYISNCRGFINRYYYKSSSELWMLVIFYETKEDALKSISDYQKWDGSVSILSNLEKDGLIFHHYDAEGPLLNKC